MRITASVVAAVLSVVLGATLQATTHGSVEPIANPAVIDTSALRDQPLKRPRGVCDTAPPVRHRESGGGRAVFDGRHHDDQ